MTETCSLCLKKTDRFITVVGLSKRAHIICESCMDPSLKIGGIYEILR